MKAAPCSMPGWGANCDVIGNCQSSSPTSGCEKTGDVCRNCDRADFVSIQPMTNVLEPHHTTGYIVKDVGFIVCQAGIGDLQEDDIIKTINGIGVSKRLFVEIEKQKPATSRLEIYRQGELAIRELRVTRKV